MKFVYHILFLVLALSLHAQFNTNTNTCKIYYEYDNAGHRIKRYYKCFDPSLPQPIVQEPRTSTNTTESAQQKLVLYPNPVSSHVSLLLSHEVVDGEVFILDAKGQVLQQEPFSGLKKEFNVAHLPSGTYFIRVHEGFNLYSEVFLKP
jgi:hypothetical protein